MKKNISVLLVMMVILLTGCGNQEITYKGKESLPYTISEPKSTVELIEKTYHLGDKISVAQGTNHIFFIIGFGGLIDNGERIVFNIKNNTFPGHSYSEVYYASATEKEIFLSSLNYKMEIVNVDYKKNEITLKVPLSE